MRNHYHRVHRRLHGVRSSKPSFPAGSLSPAQILKAYGFTQNQFASAAPVKLGIGSLGGGVVQQDITNSVTLWGMLAPKITVRTVGGATNDPTDQDSNVENMLDLIPTMAFTIWYLTGKAADITICFGPNAGDGMTLVTNDLVAAGVEVASWSWGSAASEWDASDRSSLAAAFAAAVSKGVCFCAASGDNSADDGTGSPVTDYPASDPNVWAVGGTTLTINSAGARTGEAAWGDGRAGDEGGGGGYDSSVSRPTWQQGVLPTTPAGRGSPDTSANADPNSGWQMSANGSWTVVGGTSASSPFTAALIAVAKGMAKAAGSGATAQAVYAAHATACNDITTGSNGDKAAAGWDPATGLGSPAGSSFIAAIQSWAQGGTTVPTKPVPLPPPPPPPPPAQPVALTLAQLTAIWPKTQP